MPYQPRQHWTSQPQPARRASVNEEKTHSKTNRGDETNAGGSPSKALSAEETSKAAQAKSDEQSRQSETRSKEKSAKAETLHPLISTRPLHPDGAHSNPVHKKRLV